MGQKRARAAAVEPQGVQSVHVPKVYTDCSFGLEVPQKGFAGYGVWFGPLDQRNMAQPREGELQTLNRPELSAGIAALLVVPREQALRIVTNSK